MTTTEALAFASKTMNQRLREARATGNDHDYDANMDACIDALSAEVERLRDLVGAAVNILRSLVKSPCEAEIREWLEAVEKER